jgi:hypothetical protein
MRANLAAIIHNRRCGLVTTRFNAQNNHFNLEAQKQSEINLMLT